MRETSQGPREEANANLGDGTGKRGVRELGAKASLGAKRGQPRCCPLRGRGGQPGFPSQAASDQTSDASEFQHFI